ncbi:methyltransferase domain-containing protein [Sphingomonas qilianensis]|uniref:Methyltransferase domain-containing protein n=1 Tax=Sphingomonas qilianensis TaxID=1736690 RepID=A0ABU9XT01_9SPHN
MHHTAYIIGGMAMETYCPRDGARILEVGSYAVNGALRDHASSANEYVGLDIEAGPGVDVVAQPGKPFPLEDEQFDMILASSAFEHDDAFWVTFLEMCRKAKPGGHIYISVPSNGLVHRYPQDNWRFYPDSGLALAKWARSQNLDVILVESFIAERDRDTWNDYVAVFRKGPTEADLNDDFLYQRVACSNAITWQSDAIINRRDRTEDMVLIETISASATRLEADLADKARDLEQTISRVAEADGEIARLSGRERQLAEELAVSETAFHEKAAAFDTLSHALSEEAAQVGKLREQVAASDREIGQLREHAAALDTRIAKFADALGEKDAQIEADANRLEALEAERYALANRLADSDSTLRQREEEIAQAWSELEAERESKVALQAAFDALSDRLKAQALKLDEESAWTFKLAGERRAAEQRAEAAAAALAAERAASTRGLQDLRAATEAQAAAERRAADAEAALQADSSSARGSPDLQDRSGQRIDRQFDRIAELINLLRVREEEIADTAQRGDSLQQQIDAMRQQQVSANADLADAHKQLRAAQLELATRSGALHNEQSRAKKNGERLEWLRAVNRVLSAGDRGWWAFVPPSWRRQRDLRALQRRGLFDATAYLERYPDVAAARMDALQHFICHGMMEGRRGNTDID